MRLQIYSENEYDIQYSQIEIFLEQTTGLQTFTETTISSMQVVILCLKIVGVYTHRHLIGVPIFFH